MKNLIAIAIAIMAVIMAVLFWNTISDAEEGVVQTTPQAETQKYVPISSGEHVTTKAGNEGVKTVTVSFTGSFE
jgi:hypothetical protein